EGCGHLGTHGGAVQVGHVLQRAGLLGDGLGHRRVAVAEPGHGQAAQEVEVAVAPVVPQLAPLPPHEGDALGGVRRHERGGGAHGVTMVPTPVWVKISSNSTCSCLPSRMWAWPTPARTASMHEATFGIIPPRTVPSAMRASSSPT